MKVQVTVVIPNYKGIKYIEGCLKALFSQAQGTPLYEVIVVDNASRDGSVQFIEKAFPQVRLILLRENTGFCHAVNEGIRAAESPYVLLLNNDTKAAPDFIKAMYESIERQKDCFAISARMLQWDKPELVDDAGDRYCVLGWAYSRGKGRKAALYEKPAEVFAACGGAAIYRRDIVEKIGGFDENHFAYLEDIDLGYRARIYGYKSRYEPKAEVIHYGSASTGSRYNEWKTARAAANSVYLIFKNMPILQLIWNLPFLLLGFLVKTLFFCKKRMGILYLKGLLSGLKMSFSEEGRKKKVGFRFCRLGNYLAVQWQLYVNVLRIIMKT